jgi:hypothetical protein
MVNFSALQAALRTQFQDSSVVNLITHYLRGDKVRVRTVLDKLMYTGRSVVCIVPGVVHNKNTSIYVFTSDAYSDEADQLTMYYS